MRILVVEDDPLIRELVVEALREEGYEVIHAANGEEALAWCGRRVADVLVTDIRLPGRVDGWQIAERCREQDPELAVTQRALRPFAGRRVVQRVVVAIGADVPLSPLLSFVAHSLHRPAARRARLPDRIEHCHLISPALASLRPSPLRSQVGRGKLHDHRRCLTPRP